MMKRSQILYLFISGFCYLTLGSSDFHLITLLKTYQEAKSYCREMYTDLATVHNTTDMNNLIALVSTTTATAWIGLESGGVWKWHWSWPDETLDFFKWRAGEPKEKQEDACAAMDVHSEWFESNCGIKRSFVCHGIGNTSGHFFVADMKSWREAQNHCRGLLSDLVNIHSEEENEAVHNISLSQQVWIGLFRDQWKWSDGSNSSFRFWKTFQPNYLEGQECVAATFKDKGQWNDLKCSVERRFVCRGAKRTIVTTTSQTSTNETQLTTGVTTFSNSSLVPGTTVASSHQLKSTTKEAPAARKLTTTTTTPDPVSFVNSTQFNNATTEMSTIIATHLTPTTTVQVSALPTQITSSQNTTQSSTLMPPDKNQDLTSENLILIQENMTWIEAMSYCREHHIDLVYITTEDIQKKVAEKARNSTTAHVWLGLRYTCNFDFWFWINSATGCYQNWAPGQGSEVKYDCGVTGAIEATGWQQWVGLPETEKLNFICHACAG